MTDQALAGAQPVRAVPGTRPEPLKASRTHRGPLSDSRLCWTVINTPPTQHCLSVFSLGICFLSILNKHKYIHSLTLSVSLLSLSLSLSLSACLCLSLSVSDPVFSPFPLFRCLPNHSCGRRRRRRNCLPAEGQPYRRRTDHGQSR